MLQESSLETNWHSLRATKLREPGDLSSLLFTRFCVVSGSINSPCLCKLYRTAIIWIRLYSQTHPVPGYVCINFKASIKWSMFFLTELSGYKTRATKAMKISQKKLEITDKNTIIKHQLSLCYCPLILNCDYFEYKHWHASKSTRNEIFHV